MADRSRAPVTATPQVPASSYTAQAGTKGTDSQAPARGPEKKNVPPVAAALFVSAPASKDKAEGGKNTVAGGQNPPAPAAVSPPTTPLASASPGSDALPLPAAAGPPAAPPRPESPGLIERGFSWAKRTAHWALGDRSAAETPVRHYVGKAVDMQLSFDKQLVHAGAGLLRIAVDGSPFGLLGDGLSFAAKTAGFQPPAWVEDHRPSALRLVGTAAALAKLGSNYSLTGAAVAWHRSRRNTPVDQQYSFLPDATQNNRMVGQIVDESVIAPWKRGEKAEVIGALAGQLALLLIPVKGGGATKLAAAAENAEVTAARFAAARPVNELARLNQAAEAGAAATRAAGPMIDIVPTATTAGEGGASVLTRLKNGFGPRSTNPLTTDLFGDQSWVGRAAGWTRQTGAELIEGARNMFGGPRGGNGMTPAYAGNANAAARGPMVAEAEANATRLPGAIAPEAANAPMMMKGKPRWNAGQGGVRKNTRWMYNPEGNNYLGTPTITLAPLKKSGSNIYLYEPTCRGRFSDETHTYFADQTEHLELLADVLHHAVEGGMNPLEVPNRVMKQDGASVFLIGEGHTHFGIRGQVPLVMAAHRAGARYHLIEDPTSAENAVLQRYSQARILKYVNENSYVDRTGIARIRVPHNQLGKQVVDEISHAIWKVKTKGPNPPTKLSDILLQDQEGHYFPVDSDMLNYLADFARNIHGYGSLHVERFDDVSRLGPNGIVGSQPTGLTHLDYDVDYRNRAFAARLAEGIERYGGKGVGAFGRMHLDYVYTRAATGGRSPYDPPDPYFTTLSPMGGKVDAYPIQYYLEQRGIRSAAINNSGRFAGFTVAADQPFAFRTGDTPLAEFNHFDGWSPALQKWGYSLYDPNSWNVIKKR